MLVLAASCNVMTHLSAADDAWCSLSPLRGAKLRRRCSSRHEVPAPIFLPPLTAEPSAPAPPQPGTLPCFPLPLHRAALPGSRRMLNVMERRYTSMYEDLLTTGQRRFVVPRLLQTSQGACLAEAAVVFVITDLLEAPSNSRFRYTVQHSVQKPVRITRVLNPGAFAKKNTYLRVEYAKIRDHDAERDYWQEERALFRELHEVAALRESAGDPLRRWEYMSDRSGLSRLVDHGSGPALSEDSLNAAGASREDFWELVQLWQGYWDRRGVALRQQHDRDMLAARRADCGPRTLAELRRSYEAESLEHQHQGAALMQVLLQSASHGERLKLLRGAARRELERLAAVAAVAGSTGGEAHA
ncbi:unnamed protein product [Symbiodinium sp. CCMP2592]|nr:unnamed protein product [Symbiodinium sp. CCMP2592]